MLVRRNFSNDYVESFNTAYIENTVGNVNRSNGSNITIILFIFHVVIFFTKRILIFH